MNVYKKTLKMWSLIWTNFKLKERAIFILEQWAYCLFENVEKGQCVLEPVVCTVLPKLALSLLHTRSYLSDELSVSKCPELFRMSLSGTLGHLRSIKTFRSSLFKHVSQANSWSRIPFSRKIHTTGSNIAFLSPHSQLMGE